MKKIRTMLAFILALSICASMAACGSSGDSGDKSESKAVTTDEKTDDTVTSTEADETAETSEAEETEQSATEPSEEDEEDEASKYGYYEDLAAEYEANGYSISSRGLLFLGDMIYNNSESKVYYQNGKLYFGWYRDNTNYLECYDINSKTTTERAVDFWLGNCEIRDGKLMFLNDTWESCTVLDLEDDSKSYTVDFSESNVSRPDYYKCHVLSSGAVVGYDEEDNVIYYYSQETGEVNYPGLTIKDSHGLEQKVSAEFATAYGNKLYFKAYDSTAEGDRLYCFDLDNEQWNEEPVISRAKCYISISESIGKYMIFSYSGSSESQDKLFNMETDEIVGTFSYPEDYYPKYFGGDSHLFADHEWGSSEDIERFIKVKLPIDGSSVDEDTAVKLYSSDTRASIFPVNENYYLFIDSAGVFLRSYDKGPDGEEIVCVFNN